MKLMLLVSLHDSSSFTLSLLYSLPLFWTCSSWSVDLASIFFLNPDDDLDEMVGLLDELVGLFTGVEGSGNGGLELVCSVCSNIPIVNEMFVSL